MDRRPSLKRGKIPSIVDEGVGHGVVEVQPLELARRLFRPAVDADAHEARDPVVVRAAPSLHLRRDRPAPASSGVVEVDHRGRPRGQQGGEGESRSAARRAKHLDVKLGAGLAGEVHLASRGRNNELGNNENERRERAVCPLSREEAAGGFELRRATATRRRTRRCE